MIQPRIAPIIVLGMHRSGTSLLTGSLEAAGLKLGEVNNAAPHNKKGNKENVALRDLNDAILRRVGADWRRPPTAAIAWTEAEKQLAWSLCAPYRAANQLWGFKDPRTLWTLEGWLELFPAAKLIGIFRHPALVIQSLNHRAGALKLSVEEAEELWFATNERLLDLHGKTPFPLIHFNADNMYDDFFQPVRAWTERLGLVQDSEQFFSDQLVHQDHAAIQPTDASMALFGQLIELAAKR